MAKRRDNSHLITLKSIKVVRIEKLIQNANEDIALLRARIKSLECSVEYFKKALKEIKSIEERSI